MDGKQHLVVAKYLMCVWVVLKSRFLHPWPKRVICMIKALNLFYGNNAHQWEILLALFLEHIFWTIPWKALHLSNHLKTSCIDSPWAHSESNDWTAIIFQIFSLMMTSIQMLNSKPLWWYDLGMIFALNMHALILLQLQTF